MFLKKIIFTIVLSYLFFISTTSICQIDKNPTNHFPKSSINFGVTPFIGYTLKYSQNEAHAKGIPAVSANLSVSYYRQIKKGYGINAGLSLLPLRYSFSWDWPTTVGNPVPNSQNNNASYFFMTYKFSVSILKYFSIKESLFLHPGIGLNLFLVPPVKHSFTAIEQHPNNEVVEYNQDFRVKSTSWNPGLHVSFGLTKVIERKKMGVTFQKQSISFDLIMNYSFSKITSGDFYIYQNEEETTSGTFDVFIRYVG